MTKMGLLALSILGMITVSPARASSCAPRSADPVQTIRQLYAAVTKGDTATVMGMFTDDFYAFDRGKRMTAADLGAQVDKIRMLRPALVWTVEDADAHVLCDTAWVTYENLHVPTNGKGAVKGYLESVVLIWRAGTWKLRFFHSSPAAVAD